MVVRVRSVDELTEISIDRKKPSHSGYHVSNWHGLDVVVFVCSRQLPMHSINYNGLPFNYEYIDGDPEIHGSIIYSLFPLNPLRMYNVGDEWICLKPKDSLPEAIQRFLEQKCYSSIRKMVNEAKKKPLKEMAHEEADTCFERELSWGYWL